jgi:WD40 repeat protein/serine/threonine protein kinase
MKPSDEREEVLFREALQRTNSTERAAFLEQACAGNEALRGRLEALLQAHESADTFLEPQAEPPTKATMKLEFAPEEGPGTIIGRYKLLEKVGEGGFGVVYVAEQREPVKRRVALKVIKLGMDTKQVVARFEAERQALALMDHPNIAKVLDAGATDTGRPYFVMELVKGIPITKYCDQEKLATRDRLDLFIKVCHAIQHAHQKGIIHRDIKPSNILVTLHDGVPVPKVIDFGIAKATQQELTEKTVYTQLQQFIGTPAYMSPEQAEMSGLDIDTRSDIYSLGVLLYELLTGSTPFDTKELVESGLDEMRKIIREREPVRPSTRLSQTRAARLPASGDSALPTPHSAIDSDLDWIAMKCLEKDRTRRYETANGLAMDLKRHLNHEPVLARPPSVSYRLQKSFRRNKVVFTATGMVALALLLMVVVSSWQALRATRARRDEADARLRADEAARLADNEKNLAKQQAQKAEAYLYDADMNLAGQALQQNNLGLALSCLKLHRPATPAQRELLGWEWRYLWERCRSDELATIGQHDGTVQSVAVSPDGKWVASGGFDGLLKIWALTSEPAGGRLVTNLELGGGPVGSLAFSPDGRWLAAGTWTNGFALLQAPTWQKDMTRTQRIPGSLAFSSDSRLLAVGGEVWSLDTRTCLRTFPCTHFRYGEPAVAWLPNSQTLAGFDKSNGLFQVSLFDVRSTNQDATVAVIPVRAGLGGDSVPATLAFSPDGNHLAIGCWDNTIRIHAANDWRQVEMLTNHTAWVSSLAFSKDGQLLTSASADHSIRVWGTRDWQVTNTLRGHQEEVLVLAFTPEGQRLVTGSKDHSVRLWPVAGWSKPIEEVIESAEDTKFFGLSGVCPFRVGPSNVLTIWDGQTLRERQRLFRYPVTNVLTCRPSPDGRSLLMATMEGGLWLTDLVQGAVLPPVCLQTNGSQLEAADFSDQAKWLAVADTNSLRVWDLKHQPPWMGSALAAGKFSHLRFSRDERLLAAVTGPNDTEERVFVWDVASGKELVHFQPHRDHVTGLDFSPDGAVLATVSYDNTCKRFDLRSRQELTTLPGHLLSLFSVCFSPDGHRLAAGTGGTGSSGCGIIIWDVKTEREVLVLKTLGLGVFGVRFDPSGDSLLSIVNPSTLRLWRAPSWDEIGEAEKMTRRKN